MFGLQKSGIKSTFSYIKLDFSVETIFIIILSVNRKLFICHISPNVRILVLYFVKWLFIEISFKRLFISRYQYFIK